MLQYIPNPERVSLRNRRYILGIKIMAQSLSKIYLHIIFSTKNRFPFLYNESLRMKLYSFLIGVSKKLDSPIIKISGVSEHIHLICDLSRNCSVAEIVRELKRTSSKWIQDKAPLLKTFHWQNGYSVFSVSPSNLESVKGYLEKQSEHHKKISFQEEVRKFLKKYGIKYNERYIWD